MTNFITGLIGIAGVCTFLGIMLWWIKAVPLIIICVLVMALLIYDFYQSLRANGNGAGWVATAGEFYCPWLASFCWQALLILARFCFRQARMI